MALITVLTKSASLLSFAAVQQTDGMPMLDGVTWSPTACTTPQGALKDTNSKSVCYASSGNGNVYEVITATYLILGFDDQRLQVAHVTFPGQENYAKIRQTFTARYGLPGNVDSLLVGCAWVRNGLHARLQYDVSTDESVLSVTFKNGDKVVCDHSLSGAIARLNAMNQGAFQSHPQESR